MQQHPGKFMFKNLRGGIICEVSVLFSGRGIGKNNPINNLFERPLAIFMTNRTTEVLGGHDGGGIHRPEVRVLDTALFENHLARFPVGLHHVATFPRHFVIRVHTSGGVDAIEVQTLTYGLLRLCRWIIDD